MKYFELQKAAGFTNQQAADFLGVSLKTVKNWRNGKVRTPQAVIMVMRSYVDNEVVKEFDNE